jgi:MFS family permease
VLHGAMYGPQAAFFAEQFPTRVRYTGLSVGGQLSSIAAGAVAPLIAVALFSAWGSTVPVSLYVAAMCLITVIALLAARETRGESLHDVGVDAVEAETTAVSP